MFPWLGKIAKCLGLSGGFEKSRCCWGGAHAVTLTTMPAVVDISLPSPSRREFQGGRAKGRRSRWHAPSAEGMPHALQGQPGA